MATPRDRLASLWNQLGGSGPGRWLFARIFGWAVPYSGTVGARVVRLEPGYCRTEVADRRRLRNHLDSVHAVALINLGEMTSGLAMTMALPSNIRGIVTNLSASYQKKARGTLAGEASVTIPALGSDPHDVTVTTVITDQGHDEVCRVTTVWRLERRADRAAI